MALELRLSPLEYPCGGLDPEEVAALGLLEIRAGDRLLTAGTDVSGDTPVYRPGPYVSGYHLAEWLVWNWWRLRWEPRPAGRHYGNCAWNFAHGMATAGHGYVWPNITISADGFWAALECERSHESDPTLFRYWESGAVAVPAIDLESAIDEFVLFVVNRTDAAGLSDTNLHRLWKDLQYERKDAEMARFRRFEALLGCDPDALDAEELESRLADAKALGASALDEIATGAAAGVAGLDGMPSARQIMEITERAGFDISPDDGVRVEVPELRQWGVLAAWRVGVSAAAAIRRQERLGNAPLADDVLADLAGTTAGVITGDQQSDGFSWVFRPDGRLAQVALRSKWDTGRRFDLARLLGDRVFADRQPGGPDPLSPATRSYSYRQKAQRAFAAELLSPWTAVEEMLGNDYSEENREQVAEYYSVSPMTISSLALSNADFASEDRMLFQF